MVKPNLTSLVLLAVFCSATIALGDIVPTGLKAGDQYRVMFITSGTHNALSTDIDIYNTFVNEQSQLPGSLTASMTTTWNAVGCTPTVSARANTGVDPSITGIPTYRLDGTLLASTNPSLWGGLQAASNIDQFGNVANPVPASWAHTGCRSDGTPFPARELGGPIVAVRTGTFSFASAWLNATGRSRFQAARMYAISAPLTVAVPEPSSFLCLGLVGIGLVGWKRLTSGIHPAC